MRKPSDVKGFAQDALIIICLVIFLSFMFRFWPITILAIIALLVVLVVRACKKQPQEAEEKIAEQPKEKESKLITDKELFELEYGVLTSKVSQLVEQEYPGAQWIWERPNVRKLLQNGEDVFIRLNKAGGYRRVKVLITNLFVQGLEVMPYTNEQQVKPIEEKEPSAVAEEPLKVNYELMAFDWVENHIAELNERCNNAIGDGKDSILLTAEELPVQESWASICEELKRMDLSAVEMVPEGIKITLLQ